MIVLRRLQWGNMFCYGDHNTLDLNGSDSVVQIIGANGAGKSSINLVLEELLYNKNSRGIKKADILNRELDVEEYWAELEFSVEGDAYFIRLDRKKTSKLLLLKNDEDISSHTATETYKQVATIIGDDFSTFSQKVYQGMSSSLQFLTATDSARKKFLVGLLDLEIYAELHDSLKDYAKEGSGEVRGIEASIETSKNYLTKARKYDASEEKVPPEPAEYNKSEDIEKLATLKAELFSINLHNKQYKVRVDAQRKMEQTQKLLEALDEPLEGHNLTEKDSVEAKKAIQELRSTFTAAKTLIDKLEKLGDSCPTCSLDIDSKRLATIISDNKDVMRLSKSQKAPLDTQVKQYLEIQEYKTAKKALVAKLASLEESISEMPYKALDGDVLTSKIKELSDYIEAKELHSAKVAKEISEVTLYNKLRDSANNEKETLVSRLKEEEASLSVAIEEAEKVELLKKAFSTNGIVAYRISQAIVELQKDINSYLKDFCKGRFTLHFMMEATKLNVKIQDKGRLINIQSLSSGQLARVTISAVLAIRKLINNNSVNGINLLFLDEVTATLDDEGKDQLIDILLKEKALDAFIIMHGWEHPLVPRLEVATSSEGSYIRKI